MVRYYPTATPDQERTNHMVASTIVLLILSGMIYITKGEEGLINSVSIFFLPFWVLTLIWFINSIRNKYIKN